MTNPLQTATAFDRRMALGALAAAGATLLAIPRSAKAADLDADIYAAIEQVKALERAQELRLAELRNVEAQLPKREAVKGLIAQPADCHYFKTETNVGEPLTDDDVKAARTVAHLFRVLKTEADHPLFGAAQGRIGEIIQAENEWEDLWRAEDKRPDLAAARTAYDDAANAKLDAIDAMFLLRPRSFAGLGALVRALDEFGAFENEDRGSELVHLILESVVLTVEA